MLSELLKHFFEVDNWRAVLHFLLISCDTLLFECFFKAPVKRGFIVSQLTARVLEALLDHAVAVIIF